MAFNFRFWCIVPIVGLLKIAELETPLRSLSMQNDVVTKAHSSITKTSCLKLIIIMIIIIIIIIMIMIMIMIIVTNIHTG